MADQTNASEKISFKDTLNLPRTDFPIRANTKLDDPAMIARWEQGKTYLKHHLSAMKAIRNLFCMMVRPMQMAIFMPGMPIIKFSKILCVNRNV